MGKKKRRKNSITTLPLPVGNFSTEELGHLPSTSTVSDISYHGKDDGKIEQRENKKQKTLIKEVKEEELKFNLNPFSSTIPNNLNIESTINESKREFNDIYLTNCTESKRKYYRFHEGINMFTNKDKDSTSSILKKPWVIFGFAEHLQGVPCTSSQSNSASNGLKESKDNSSCLYFGFIGSVRATLLQQDETTPVFQSATNTLKSIECMGHRFLPNKTKSIHSSSAYSLYSFVYRELSCIEESNESTLPETTLFESQKQLKTCSSSATTIQSAESIFSTKFEDSHLIPGEFWQKFSLFLLLEPLVITEDEKKAIPWMYPYHEVNEIVNSIYRDERNSNMKVFTPFDGVGIIQTLLPSLTLDSNSSLVNNNNNNNKRKAQEDHHSLKINQYENDHNSNIINQHQENIPVQPSPPKPSTGTNDLAMNITALNPLPINYSSTSFDDFKLIGSNRLIRMEEETSAMLGLPPIYEPNQDWNECQEAIIREHFCIYQKHIALNIKKNSTNIQDESLPNMITVVSGGKGMGKSSFVRILTNKFLTFSSHQQIVFGSTDCGHFFHRVALLDLDVGQPESGPPGLLSLTLIQDDIENIVDKNEGNNQISSAFLAPSFVTNREPLLSLCYGAVTPKDELAEFFEQVRTLYLFYLDYQKSCNTPLPLIVNMHGWTKGLGEQLFSDIFQLLQPSFHVNLSCHKIGSSSINNESLLSKEMNLSNAAKMDASMITKVYNLLAVQLKPTSQRMNTSAEKSLNSVISNWWPANAPASVLREIRLATYFTYNNSTQSHFNENNGHNTKTELQPNPFHIEVVDNVSKPKTDKYQDKLIPISARFSKGRLVDNESSISAYLASLRPYLVPLPKALMTSISKHRNTEPRKDLHISLASNTTEANETTNEIEIIPCHGELPESPLMLDLINAQIVGLLSNLNQNNGFQTLSSGEIKKNHCSCIGLGIVRGYDLEKGFLYILTNALPARLNFVNIIAVTSLDVPALFLHHQSGQPCPYLTYESAVGEGSAILRSRKNLLHRRNSRSENFNSL